MTITWVWIVVDLGFEGVGVSVSELIIGCDFFELVVSRGSEQGWFVDIGSPKEEGVFELLLLFLEIEDFVGLESDFTHDLLW